MPPDFWTSPPSAPVLFAVSFVLLSTSPMAVLWTLALAAELPSCCDSDAVDFCASFSAWSSPVTACSALSIAAVNWPVSARNSVMITSAMVEQSNERETRQR
jgi:hypothetical protein